MAKVELSLSEAFHKHKRNLVLLCSAISVLRIASPNKIKLPFVGADVDLPSWVAFLLLAIALVYMFSQYYVEYITMLARNSSAVLTSGSTVDQVIETHLASMTSWADSLQVSQTNHVLAISSIRTGNTDKVIKDYVVSLDRLLKFETPDKTNLQRAIAANDPNDRIERSFLMLTNSINSIIKSSSDTMLQSLTKIDHSLIELQAYQATVTEKLSEYSDTYRAVLSAFKKLSSNIGSAQRIGFRWIDGYFVIAFAALSLGCCATGALGWRINPPVPTAGTEPAKALPKLVQKPNTTVPTLN